MLKALMVVGVKHAGFTPIARGNFNFICFFGSLGVYDLYFVQLIASLQSRPLLIKMELCIEGFSGNLHGKTECTVDETSEIEI